MKRPLPKLSEEYDSAIIVQIISASCTTVGIAALIAHSLVTYVHSKRTRMTALRANAVFSFQDDDNSWPMIEWTESDDTKNVAIFHFGDPEEPEEGSWLMHSGHEISGDEGLSWQNSRIDWNVADIEHLKTLFVVVKHIMGVLSWSSSDALQLYGGINPPTSSTEYVPRELNLN
jgi:hypothetical protein